MLQEQGGSTANPVHLAFEFVNVLDAADDMLVLGSAVGATYRAIRKGSIIGISVQHSADLTGGVITYNPDIGGTAQTALAAVTEDTIQGAQSVIPAGEIPFVAGDLLGIAYTKTGTVAPTTTDVVALLEILYEDEEF